MSNFFIDVKKNISKAIKWLVYRKEENENNFIYVEELSELAKEVCKYGRHKGNVEHLLDELADVHIVLEMIRVQHGLKKEEIINMIGKKMIRNLMREGKSLSDFEEEN